MPILPAGTVAPPFTLRSTPDQSLSLSDFKGRNVILAFYPADWSPVCGDQLALYNELLPEFARHDAQLLGLSVDGAWCHAALAHDRHSRTSNPRARSRVRMARTTCPTASRSGRCS